VDPGPGQQLARAINEYARALCAHTIEAPIRWVRGHSGIPRNKEAGPQAIIGGEDRGYTVQELINTSAANGARRITEGGTAGEDDVGVLQVLQTLPI